MRLPELRPKTSLALDWGRWLLSLGWGISLLTLTAGITPLYAQDSELPESIELNDGVTADTIEFLDTDTLSPAEQTPPSALEGEATTGSTVPLETELTEPASRPEAGSWLRILQRTRPQGPVFETYRLGPGDGIAVEVQRFADLNFQATLDLQGNITVPLAGTVNLTGLTPEQARDTIYALYDQYVVEPQISLTLTAQRPVEVTIVGAVPRPGVYPLSEPNLSAALVTAGGATTLADLRAVQVRRLLSHGEVVEHSVDLFTPLHQGDSIPQVRLQNGDVVVVPQLNAASLAEYDRSLVAISTLAKPEITVRIMNRATGGRGTEARFGAITLRNGSHFLDALAQAGVNPDLAAYHRIAVIRFNPATGAAETVMVDAQAAINGDAAHNIPLQDNDVLVVDRNTLARITFALNTVTQPFRDVLGFLLFFDSFAETTGDLF